jgi:hypothetical protein
MDEMWEEEQLYFSLASILKTVESKKEKKKSKKMMFATFCGLQRNFQLIEPKKIFNLRKIKIKQINGKACK